ncbi:MAG: DUF4129 domain-containing protein [Actinomycetota bacterium]|nr:DUF4129 domain-containing protein [Actinomycetota bacterium]
MLILVPVVVMTDRPRAATAEEMTRQELASLARRAAGDPAALERLRRVDAVDGRRVDLRRALDAPGPEAAERARTLAEDSGAPAAPTVEPAVGDDARDILSEGRFRPQRSPRPFAGALRRIGGWLRPVGRPIGGLVETLGGARTMIPVLAAVVVLLAAAACVRVARRRTATNLAAGLSARRPTPVEPGELERQADAAERGNDLERALRLRFEAGLLRLHDARRLRLRASTTTGEVLRAVPSPELGKLATTLEEVVYGGRRAQAPDIEAARTGWERVLEETRR